MNEYECRYFWEPSEWEKALKAAEAQARIFGYALIEFDISNLNDNFGE